VRKGSIRIRDQLVASPAKDIATEKRSTGMVFQEYALFPHLDVKSNIVFGIRRWPLFRQQQRLQHLANLVKLQPLLHRYPHELSGGQQQRVALARAMAPRPDLLLLDEPFSNLDSALRGSLASEVRQILKQENVTAVLVTHDQNEALTLSDKVNLMHQGSIVQSDSPYDLYHHPRHRFTAEFLGKGKLVTGIMRDNGLVTTRLGMLTCAETDQFEAGTKVDVLIRAEHVRLDSEGNIPVKVKQRAFKGAQLLYTLEMKTDDLVNETILALWPNFQRFDVEDEIRVSLQAGTVSCFPKVAEAF
jgi:iron(III) transport system ATP-binding protein